jgi:vacuolar-type H+-ATPase subunit H
LKKAEEEAKEEIEKFKDEYEKKFQEFKDSELKTDFSDKIEMDKIAQLKAIKTHAESSQKEAVRFIVDQVFTIKK